MPQFCSACGAQMADGSAACTACGKGMPTASGGAQTSSGGLDQNIAGLLAYLFIPAIIFLVMEPYNKDRVIRFHSFQSLFLGVVSIVGHLVLAFIPILGWILMFPFALAILIIGIIAAVKAYQGQKWMIPVIGEMAEKQANAM